MAPKDLVRDTVSRKEETSLQHSYYSSRVTALQDVFGVEDVEVEASTIRVGRQRYPIVNDVIILLEETSQPGQSTVARNDEEFARDIQASFGAEWRTFSRIEPEHEAEFQHYFDLVDVESLQGARVADLGCGMGRWSYFLADHCKEVILVDFSEAIFVARETLRDKPNALFFMGDVLRLPFRPAFADFAFSLGVLHHLPVDALSATRRLAWCAPRFLVYLYYALDNRPWYFRTLLAPVNVTRRGVSRIRSHRFRSAFTTAVAGGIYRPLVGIGAVMAKAGAGHLVPLYETYSGKSFGRIRQDVYDRFFTSIEQRVTREQIMELKDTFSSVQVSEGLPFWHFLLEGPKAPHDQHPVLGDQ